MNLKFFLIFFTITSLGFSQENSHGVAFIPNFEKDKIYNFKITKTKKQEKQGVIQKDVTNSYNAKLEVLEKTANNYKLKWNYDFDFSQFNLPDDLTKNLKDLLIAEVIYTSGLDGEFLEVLNWKELGQKLSEMTDFTADLAISNNPNVKSDMERFKTYMKELFSVRANVQALGTKELQLLHNSLGGEYSVGDTYEFEESRTNPYGGDAIKAKNLLYVKKSNNKQSYIITVESVIDQQDSKNFILNLLKQLKVEEKEFENELKKSSFELNEISEFEYSTTLQLPIRVETKRFTTINIAGENGTAQESTKIELVSK